MSAIHPAPAALTPETVRALAYRPEIDGLRAIAVVAVILFHAGIAGVSGGFVGVDVFFVISGYLITAILARGSGNPLGSELARFYERRVRRLFPAFFTVLVAGLVASAFILGPQDLADAGKSAVTAALSASNIYFWRTAGYFDAPAETKPFLHSWSLGTEEQFYLIFPALLWALLRYCSRRVVGIVFVLATLVSFGLSEALVRWKPEAAFYLLPSRAWELALGSLLALGFVLPVASRLVREGLAWLGMALVLASIVLITPEMRFPGHVALAPCIGTALLIYATSGTGTSVGHVLQTRPMVLVGLMSYSLYLWHWPILVLARYANDHRLSAVAVALCLGLTVVLSALSWRFVEQPVRRRQVLASRMSIVLASIAMLVVAGGLSYQQIRRANGAESMLAVAADEVARKRIAVLDTCTGFEQTRDELLARCSFGDPKATRTFAVYGDSHAPAILPVFADLAAAQNWRGILLFRAGCPPLVGVTAVGAVTYCASVAENSVANIAALQPQLTFIVTRWSIYADGWMKRDRLQRQTHFLSDGTPTRDPARSREVLERFLARTLTELQKYTRPVLVHSTPTLPDDIGNFWNEPARPGANGDGWRYTPRGPTALDLLRKVAAPLQVGIVDTAPAFCDNASCRYRDAGGFFYTDDNHLSVYGAGKLRDLFLAPLTGAEAGRNSAAR